MRRVLRAAALTAALLSLAAACGLDDSEVIIGAGPSDGDASPDVTVPDASRDATGDGSLLGDATITDSGTDANDSGVTDAGADATDAEADAAFDAGVDAGPCPAAIVCDGNPSACGSGQVCVPDVPAGWTLVGFDDPSQVASALPCGAPYAASSETEVTDGGASATCACSCTAGTPPSCSNALVTLFTGGSGCGMSDETVSVSTACTDLTPSFPVQNSKLLYELQTDPTTCAPNLTIDAGSWSAGAARECDVNGDAGALCANHATCVSASGASHTACVTQAYAGNLPPACGASCPTGYQNSCFAVGGSINDGRTCTGCACGWSSPGCDNPTVDVFDTAGCTGATDSVSGVACDPATNVGSVASVGFTGTTSVPTCDVTTPASPSGTVAVGSEAIVCCAN